MEEDDIELRPPSGHWLIKRWSLSSIFSLLPPAQQAVVIPGDNLVRAQKTSVAIPLLPCAVNEGPFCAALCVDVSTAITQTHKH